MRFGLLSALKIISFKRKVLGGPRAFFKRHPVVKAEPLAFLPLLLQAFREEIGDFHARRAVTVWIRGATHAVIFLFIVY
ncbi:hypothetical protein SDC9_97688 [bioreactor metagenome]|uniref:Uncharacterized protein n=1 Tax=bioreactor metagenome TaxID=1076179 RepID=A0A645ACL7_9ZZZZ